MSQDPDGYIPNYLRSRIRQWATEDLDPTASLKDQNPENLSNLLAKIQKEAKEVCGLQSGVNVDKVLAIIKNYFNRLRYVSGQTKKRSESNKGGRRRKPNKLELHIQPPPSEPLMPTIHTLADSIPEEQTDK